MLFADHFSAQAAGYTAFRPRYPDTLFEFLARVSPARQRAWDCGTGNGQAAIGLARHFRQVVATDASSAQIAQAEPHLHIEYRVATAEQSGLPDGSVDLVTVAQALHWFDFDRFYAEVRRVTVSGGVIAAWSYGLMQVNSAVDAVVQRFFAGLAADWPAERRFVDEQYRTLPFPFEPVTVPPFSMQQHWTLPQLLGYLRTWSAVQAFQRREKVDPVAGVAEELANVWVDEDGPRQVRWPLAVRVGRV
jgi:SAM-dependent methyltransferase